MARAPMQPAAGTRAEMAATHLDEQPRGDKSQAAVLPVESVVVSIEGKVVQIEEPAQKGSRYQDTSMDRINKSLFSLITALSWCVLHKVVQTPINMQLARSLSTCSCFTMNRSSTKQDKGQTKGRGDSMHELKWKIIALWTP